MKKIHSCCQILLRKRANCFTFYLKMKRNTRFQSGSIWKSFLLMFIADVHTNDALMGKIYYQQVQSRQHFCKRLWIIENTCNIFVSLRIKYWNESFFTAYHIFIINVKAYKKKRVWYMVSFRLLNRYARMHICTNNITNIKWMSLFKLLNLLSA